jgi:hypothetical protein
VITLEQLLEVFASYNPQIWPMQIIVYLIGFAGVFLAVKKTAFSSRAVPAILAFFWLWVGFFFWLPSVLQGFTPGIFFTAVFLIQGLLFVIQAVKPKLSFGFTPDASSIAGIFFLLYAMAGYPLVSILDGHVYPRMAPFGLTPCPVVTFTFGLLLLTRSRVPKAVLVLPFFYALSGFLWISIGMWEDIGMLASGLLGGWLIWVRDSKLPAVQQTEDTQTPAETGWSLDLSDKN